MKKKLLFPVLVLLIFNGCKNEVSIQIDENINSEELKTEKETYAPYELLSFQIDDSNLFNKSIVGMIGGRQVEITTSDSVGTFVVPNLAEGPSLLEFSQEKINYKASITIKNPSSVQSPDVYINEIETSINERISSIEAQKVIIVEMENNTAYAAAIEEDIKKYKALLANYKTTYNNFSPIEKEEFARYIEANKGILNEFNMLNRDLADSYAYLRTSQVITDYEKNVAITKIKYLTALSWTLAHIPLIIAMAKVAALTPDPITKSSAILALGLVMINMQLNIEDLKAATGKLTNEPLKPFENLDIPETVFETGRESPVTARASYRSIFEGDESDPSNGSIVSGLFRGIQSFKTAYNDFVDRLPVMFKPKSVIPSIRPNFKTKLRSLYNKYIKISNVNNSLVKVRKIDNVDGSTSLKVESSANTDQNFTFDLEYSNSEFTKNLKKRISAKVTAQVDSSDIYAVSAIGHYNVSGFKGNGPNSRLTCDLHGNNKAVYTIYNDPSWEDGTTFSENWRVNKIDGHYYITTSFTNPGHQIKEAKRLTYPVMSFIYVDNYIK